ncbi:MAG: YceI family protein [Bacteroidetes bacterium]|nr:MAG: YceI family protein [Bacteroidota bacterium]
MKFLVVFCLLFFESISPGYEFEKIYRGDNGYVHFVSEAPLEVIEASSRALQGILNTDKGSFAFSVPMKSFEGFNSPLQRVHFNENYLESNQFPNTTFQGKIIEKIDLSVDGAYNIRAKGKLTVHGITKERIIKSKVLVKNGKINIKSNFTVLLEDHDIDIPKIVFQKIAEEIKVDIEINLETP